MSQFDQYTRADLVEAYRKFLQDAKEGFLQAHGLIDGTIAPKRGRQPRYPAEAVRAVAFLVNEKAARVEADDTDLGERIRLAMAYRHMTDAELGRTLDVSRELVRRWGEGLNKPQNLEKLAETLGVPVKWLTEGGDSSLLANSELGVRVGKEALALREQLYSLTLEHLADVPETADLPFIQAYLEWAVFNHPEMARVARQAGGRWQVKGEDLVFAPWVPIAEHGLYRKLWTTEVEAIIQEELAKPQTTYAAWKALERRCEALGLGADKFPKKISLYKRLDLAKERLGMFGLDMNQEVAESVAKHAQKG